MEYADVGLQRARSGRGRLHLLPRIRNVYNEIMRSVVAAGTTAMSRIYLYCSSQVYSLSYVHAAYYTLDPNTENRRYQNQKQVYVMSIYGRLALSFRATSSISDSTMLLNSSHPSR